MATPVTRLLGFLLLLLLCGTGCSFLGVKKQREAFQGLARIHGEVRVEPEIDSQLVVVLGRASDDPKDVDPATGALRYHVVDHFVLEHAGAYAFVATPGSFRLAAFADRNANLVYDPGEPALAPQPPFEMAAGSVLDDADLVIPRDASLDQSYDIRVLQARTPKDQENFSLGRFTVFGDVVDLSDSKFGEKSGSLGMWRFADFLFNVGPGVYFLEAYDPAKIPVLFVHGISGYPQQFSKLIEGLDRKRFQPWFYFYPSGVHLDRIAAHFRYTVRTLQQQHGFDQLVVVAHSMGGLVSRAFILESAANKERFEVPLFVAISSPWGGSEAAANVGDAPKNYVVYSWLDMSPTSAFLTGLFFQPPEFAKPQPLPEDTEFHMLFGYKRKERSFGPSGDGVLTTKSETRIEAIEAARSVLPLDYDHVQILDSPEASARLNAILAERFAPKPWKLGSH